MPPTLAELLSPTKSHNTLSYLRSLSPNQKANLASGLETILLPPTPPKPADKHVAQLLLKSPEVVECAFGPLPGLAPGTWDIIDGVLARILDEGEEVEAFAIRPHPPDCTRNNTSPWSYHDEHREQYDHIDFREPIAFISEGQPDPDDTKYEKQPEEMHRQVVLPTLQLSYSVQGHLTNITTLIDSGAAPNAMSLATAIKLGLNIRQPEGRDKYVKMADKSISPVAGTANVFIKLGSAKGIEVPFLVLKDCP